MAIKLNIDLPGGYPKHRQDKGRIMTVVKRSVVSALSAAGMAGVFLFAGANKAIAADCGHSWAQPGKYKISGSFRGKNESTNAFLGKDCRITLQVPGVFTGGKVSKSGKCLKFSFKIEGNTKVLRAKWCDDYGLIPWQDKTLRAAITPLFNPSSKKKTNF